MDDDFDLEEELERELQAAEEEAPEAKEGAPSAPPEGAQQQQPEQAAEQAEPTLAAGSEEAEDPAQQLEHRKRERQRRNQEVLKLLTEEQLDRYEAFRRSSLSKANMKRLLHSVTGQAPNPNTTIVMCGIAKIFVGDLIETAREIAAEAGERGALRPAHIHKAFQRLDAEGKVPHRARKAPRLRL